MQPAITEMRFARLDRLLDTITSFVIEAPAVRVLA
jgi:hypothetical protein